MRGRSDGRSPPFAEFRRQAALSRHRRAGPPGDPAQRVALLERTRPFDHRLTTGDKRNHNHMYAESAAREEAQRDTGDYQEFLRGLKMVMEGSALDAARERVIELINKTNQFNLTTRRYNWSQLAAAMRGGFGRCYRLTDRFGDNGIIGVVASPATPRPTLGSICG